MDVARWLWGLSVNWDAWSAIGTIAATVVALFLPLHVAKREWVRQDRIRQESAEDAKLAIANAQHEVCSAVDRVLAYREAAIAVFDSAPVYWVGVQAITRINLNTIILLETLDLIEGRPELSDGALYAAVAARRIAAETIAETDKVLKNWGTLDPAWPTRKAALSDLDELAAMVKNRSDAVREHYGLDKSQTAEKIRTKYLPLAAAIKAAIAGEKGEPPNTLAENYL